MSNTPATDVPSREMLASLLAALHYSQYTDNVERDELSRNIEIALKDYDIGAGAFVDHSDDPADDPADDCEDEPFGPDYQDGFSDEPDFADPGGNSALRAASKTNPRNLPCPTCRRPDLLTPADKARGYQCDSCADRAERGGY